MSERVTGYSLLVIGIIVMIFSTFQIIFVFTGKAEPIPLFQQEQTEPQNVQSQDSGFNPADILKQIQGTANGVNAMPKVQIIDPDVLNNVLNLTVYYFIMQFLLGLGFKLASLGVQLVRPIHVHLKNKNTDTQQTHN